MIGQSLGSNGAIGAAVVWTASWNNEPISDLNVFSTKRILDRRYIFIAKNYPESYCPMYKE